MTTEEKIDLIYQAVVKNAQASDRLIQAAQKVVDARYYQGDDGWDVLKNAIAELEGLL